MKNGYSLSRAWFDWAFENPDKVNVNHTALYMWYIEKWNRVGQKDKFSTTTSESMEAVGFKSRNTFSNTLKDLISFGFVVLVKKSNNQNTCNIITLAQKISKQKDSKRTALDKALIQQESKQEDSNYTINKQITINKEQQTNIAFDVFWDLYEKKKGNRQKCEKKWEKLTNEEREKIIKTLPDFKKSTPDVQFRPFPETYLNGKRWEDELNNTVTSGNDYVAKQNNDW